LICDIEGIASVDARQRVRHHTRSAIAAWTGRGTRTTDVNTS
jgi:hypothetical protein